MGVVFAGLFGLGIVLYTSIQTDVHLDHILFGDILGVSPADLWQTGIIALAVTLIVLAKWRDLLLFTFDPQQAGAIGLPVRLLHYGLLALLSLTIVAALTAVGICQPGDVLGMIDGEVVHIGRGLLAVAFGLVDRLLAVGAELMTVVVGAGAPSRTGELIEAHVRGRAPLTDVSVYQGGQPDQPVIIGVE